MNPSVALFGRVHKRRAMHLLFNPFTKVHCAALMHPTAKAILGFSERRHKAGGDSSRRA
jgi:hypothetical protein